MEGLASNYTSMRMKGESVVNAALEFQLLGESQWSRKSSSIVACENMVVQFVENNQFMLPTPENIWNVTSSVSNETPKAKKAIQQSINH